MKGTLSQIAWAKKIQAERIEAVRTLFAVPADSEEKSAMRVKIIALVESEKMPASWWIDTRRHNTLNFCAEARNRVWCFDTYGTAYTHTTCDATIPDRPRH